MASAATLADRALVQAALLEVQAALTDLIAVVDEQHAAIAAGEVEQLEALTRKQEALNARLARAERKRMAALGEASLRDAGGELVDAIGAQVVQLRERQRRNEHLLNRSAQIAQQTVEFLQRVVGEYSHGYGTHTTPIKGRSLLVDGRA